MAVKDNTAEHAERVRAPRNLLEVAGVRDRVLSEVDLLLALRDALLEVLAVA